ncbi:phosphatidylinositol transfer protein [Plasmodium gonderi]|uniref:Phosphatidylinositol transfer protein n=1 Tax=Plasmodium gonderi TaxID=77519 RepID=A0A1Y1JKT8_PLAGO|nr:phosphatidylinositol transfer protein [Plasmodium gonderi]GAW82065.1 phosphatidylinositol transfer protein [Plasmodium gonderi]
MKLVEFRLAMPLTMEEYKICQLYLLARVSHEDVENTLYGVGHNNKFDSRSLVILKNNKYEDENGNDSKYIFKRMNLVNKIPKWLLNFVDPKYCLIDEKSWIAYPYLKTEYEASGFPKARVHVESTHFPGYNTEDNPFNISEELLAQRKVINIDIVNDKLPSKDYLPEEDPTLFYSEKAKRGRLTEDWINNSKVIMTCYKLFTIDIPYFGMFCSKLENWIVSVIKESLLKYHRKGLCWIDDWMDLSDEYIRNSELESQRTLEEFWKDVGLNVEEDSSLAVEFMARRDYSKNKCNPMQHRDSPFVQKDCEHVSMDEDNGSRDSKSSSSQINAGTNTTSILVGEEGEEHENEVKEAHEQHYQETDSVENKKKNNGGKCIKDDCSECDKNEKVEKESNLRKCTNSETHNSKRSKNSNIQGKEDSGETLLISGTSEEGSSLGDKDEMLHRIELDDETNSIDSNSSKSSDGSDGSTKMSIMSDSTGSSSSSCSNTEGMMENVDVDQNTEELIARANKPKSKSSSVGGKVSNGKTKKKKIDKESSSSSSVNHKKQQDAPKNVMEEEEKEKTEEKSKKQMDGIDTKIRSRVLFESVSDIEEEGTVTDNLDEKVFDSISTQKSYKGKEEFEKIVESNKLDHSLFFKNDTNENRSIKKRINKSSKNEKQKYSEHVYHLNEGLFYNRKLHNYYIMKKNKLSYYNSRGKNELKEEINLKNEELHRIGEFKGRNGDIFVVNNLVSKSADYLNSENVIEMEEKSMLDVKITTIMNNKNAEQMTRTNWENRTQKEGRKFEKSNDMLWMKKMDLNNIPCSMIGVNRLDIENSTNKKDAKNIEKITNVEMMKRHYNIFSSLSENIDVEEIKVMDMFILKNKHIWEENNNHNMFYLIDGEKFYLNENDYNVEKMYWKRNYLTCKDIEAISNSFSIDMNSVNNSSNILDDISNNVVEDMYNHKEDMNSRNMHTPYSFFYVLSVISIVYSFMCIYKHFKLMLYFFLSSFMFIFVFLYHDDMNQHSILGYDKAYTFSLDAPSNINSVASFLASENKYQKGEFHKSLYQQKKENIKYEFVPFSMKF